MIVVNWNLISYLIGQGKGQFEVLYRAESIEDFLSNPDLTVEIKSKIELINSIKQFCNKELGMSPGEKYSSIYNQNGKDILWNLTACKAYSLTSLEWEFPLIGSVSYKGFFELEKAKKEEEILIEKGYDTRIRTVSAWSTLGWFNDPILSKTLERSEGSLAELIIHEITHSHIFYADSLVFNENIASFIGEEGARIFLNRHFGDQSLELKEYLDSEHDYEKFTRHVLNSKDQLGKLYEGFDNSHNALQKSALKKSFMQQFVSAMDTISFADSTRFAGAFRDQLPNNAFFMAFDRYASMKDEMREEMDSKFGGNLKQFIDFHMARAD